MNTRPRFAVSALNLATSARLGAVSASPRKAATPVDQAISEAGTEADARTLVTTLVTVGRREQVPQRYASTARALNQECIRGMGINKYTLDLGVAESGPDISSQEGNLEFFVRDAGSASDTELGHPEAWTSAAIVLSSMNHAATACAPNTRSDSLAAWALGGPRRSSRNGPAHQRHAYFHGDLNDAFHA